MEKKNKSIKKVVAAKIKAGKMKAKGHLEGKVAEKVAKQMDLKNKELEATNKKAQAAIEEINEKAKKTI